MNERVTTRKRGEMAGMRMEVWELASWDEVDKKYVPDKGQLAQLRCVGVTDHIEEAPELYKGVLPTQRCRAFIRGMEKALRDSQRKRGG